MLVDQGLLYRNGGGWQLRTGELPVPESVHGIIAARLDTLAPDEKDVLRNASVVGRGFWPGAVSAVGGVAPGKVETLLHVLERKELVRRLGASAVAGELQYSFHHALVRDVAYGQIPRAERARKHCLAAGWIEELGRSEDQSETIAHHYLEALEYARGAGQDTREFAERARTALRDAGDRALSLSAFETAAQFYGGALELWPGDDADRPGLLFCLGKALSRTAAPDEVVLEDARDALLAAGDVERAAECDVIIGELLWRSGNRELAFERLTSGVERLHGRPPSFSKAYALSTLSRFRIAADDADGAVELARAAGAIAEKLELDELRSHTLNTIGVARATTGDRGGLADLERSIEIAREANSPESIRGYFNLGSMEANYGDLRRARELYAQGRAFAERFGDPAWTDWLDAEEAYQRYWAGEWEGALQLAEDLLARAEQGSRRLELDGCLVRGWIALARGDVTAALADADRAHAFSRAAEDPQNLYPALAFRARALLAAGRVNDASAAVDELLRSIADTPSLPSFWVLDLVVALLELGRAGELRAAVAATPSTRWLEAALAHADGDFARAAQSCAAIGTKPDEAYAQLRGGVQRENALSFFRSVRARVYLTAGEAPSSARR